MTTTTRSASRDRDDQPKKAKEVPIVQDCGTFEHATGDVYEGYFEAKKKDRSVKMHGPGVYTSSQGDSYTGHWEADKLGANQQVFIVHEDGSRYEGTFKDWQYIGFGQYTYPDGSILKCGFSNNCPIGHLNLKDTNEHTWLGYAETGFAWFEPVNHYYQHLEGRGADVVREKRRRKKSASEVKEVEVEAPPVDTNTKKKKK